MKNPGASGESPAPRERNADGIRLCGRALRSIRFDPDGSDQIAASRRLAFDQGHNRRGTASLHRLIDSGIDLPDAPINVGRALRGGKVSASLDLGLVLSNLGLAGDRVIQVITASVFCRLRRSRHRLTFCPSAIFGDSRCAHGDALRNLSTARV